MTDTDFPYLVADRLAALPHVHAVALGGSRAQGTHTPDSDWDFALYYRGTFDPEHLRGIGWPGEVCELGAWGGGVFNGGAWLTIEDRHVDVHYRDLDAVEHEIDRGEQGRFHWEPLMFHLAGIPSYLVVAELALGQTLRGTLPRPGFPAALRSAAHTMWRDRAVRTLRYAEGAHVARGHATEFGGAVAVAALESAHAVLAARGEWVTNEKRLLERAGLREIDEIRTELRGDPAALARTLTAVEAVLVGAMRCAVRDGNNRESPYAADE
ncbi:nucleotidyltransferase domain-containing protein [Nocardia callitridis]|uniref:Nucleotidyltransferase domain-containing protein n=2 Tax=Nocardia callitridis TaxID=648753 RepID=A0ABP9KUL9_9NOCA